MIKWLKSCFGIYENGYEYWIPIDQITIKKEFLVTSPRVSKYLSKEKNFLRYGTLSPIILNHDFELEDGYISFLLLSKFDCGKVPVQFVN